MSAPQWALFAFALNLVVVVANATETRTVPGQFIVRFAAGTTIAEANGKIDTKRFEVARALVPSLGLFLLKIKPGANMTAKQAVGMMTRTDDVVYAQEDHIVSLRETVPDDEDFSKLWNMKNEESRGADIRATQAWDLGTGGKDRDNNELVVAVVDGGMDVTHKDLKDNVWVNKGEIPDNGIDDDGNGYIDDVNGWNAFSAKGVIPANSHGTHVGGIIGASGNNGKHVAGVNWNVKIMAVAGSSGQTSIVAAAYGYVLAQRKLWLESGGTKGANVVVTNSSFGVDAKKCDTGDFPMWNDLYNEMGKVGILSAAATANAALNVDEKGDIPTSCSSEFLITVTNTDKNDKKNTRAAWGLTTVNLGAPGTAVYSTLPNDRAGALTGTSMSTPHVAGAVAFLHSVASSDFHTQWVADPAAGARTLKRLILENVDANESLAGMTTTGGRLNLAKAANAMHEYRGQTRR